MLRVSSLTGSPKLSDDFEMLGHEGPSRPFSAPEIHASCAYDRLASRLASH